MTTELFHMGLCVTDIDASLRYYGDVVGFEVGTPIDRRSATFDELSNNRGTHVRVAYLRRGAFVLQLIQYIAAGDTALDLHHNKPGCAHLCFYVDDVDATYERLVDRADVVITSKVVQLGPSMRSFYTNDPDGLPVEFLQLTGGATSDSVLVDGGLAGRDA
jgi:catechol 2,3-dioxygenase-like lactoylglutathione lyase family enzyme